MFQLVTLVVALGAPSPSGPSDSPEGERVSTVAAIERLPLAVPVNRVILSVDSLAMRIDLTTTADTRAIQQRFLASDPQLCPYIHREQNAVVLQCRTPRIEARLDQTGGKPVLEIHEVRGLPLHEDGDQIWFFYHPIALHFGSGCPGDTAPARGECHFKAGRFTEAALEFRKALTGEYRRLASLRLGDISLRTGDTTTAAGWYRMAGRFGSYGRLATARLCEMGGGCLGEMRKHVFDATMLPEPLHSEMLLRGARAHAYIGAVKDSMAALVEAMRANPRVCDDETRVLCRRLVLFALKFPDLDGAVETVEAYMALPGRTEGFLSIEMVRAAAEKCLGHRRAAFRGQPARRQRAVGRGRGCRCHRRPPPTFGGDVSCRPGFSPRPHALRIRRWPHRAQASDGSALGRRGRRHRRRRRARQLPSRRCRRHRGCSRPGRGLHRRVAIAACAPVPEQRSGVAMNNAVSFPIPRRPDLAPPIGETQVMQDVLAAAEDVSPANTTVLLLGESGTGKEVFARYIHGLSPRGAGPWIAVNCAALPGELLESELFGHEKGSFTGASDRRLGRIEQADHGTLLLDEISEMPLPLQAKLLRVLQERELDRVGGARPIPVDVRIIATSNRDLATMVARGEFRADLYYRLSVFPILPAALARAS